MNKNYPFDPNFIHHSFIAVGFAVWIFVFLFFTEPLDIHVFNFKQKLMILPLYSIAVAIIYFSILPFQYYIFKKTNTWGFKSEVSFFLLFLLINFIFSRLLFLYSNQNGYSLIEFFQFFYIPAVVTLFPILILSRWSLGRYYEKKMENKKIEIKGLGNYEGLRVFSNDLVFIQASDNYIEVSYIEFGKITKSLIRTKLSIIKTTFPYLLQVHRSYLINPYHFKQYKVVKGKSYLSLKGDVLIPVSKTFLEPVKIELHFTT